MAHSNIGDNAVETRRVEYTTTVRALDDERVQITLLSSDEQSEIQITTSADAVTRNATDATLTATNNGHRQWSRQTSTVGLQIECDAKRVTRSITWSDTDGTALGRIECDPEEWGRITGTMLRLLLPQQQRTDALKLAMPPVTNPDAIRSRLLERIAESKGDGGAEIDCLDVQLEDARRALEREGIASEGGCVLGSGVYDLDIHSRDTIDRPLRRPTRRGNRSGHGNTIESRNIAGKNAQALETDAHAAAQPGQLRTREGEPRTQRGGSKRPTGNHDAAGRNTPPRPRASPDH